MTLKNETQKPAQHDINDRNFFFQKYQEMTSHAKDLARLIREHDVIKVVTHIDADGISSGSIAVQALKRAGKEWTIQFEKQLDPLVIEKLHQQYQEATGKGEKVLFWFTDFGSGQVQDLEGINFIICDHHVPEIPEPEEAEDSGKEMRGEKDGVTRDSGKEAGPKGEKANLQERSVGEGMGASMVKKGTSKSGSKSQPSGQTSLFDFNKMPEKTAQKAIRKVTSSPGKTSLENRQERELNPHFFGLSGADHISGAGVSYLVAQAMDPSNDDLSRLAVVGAVGDLQATHHCKLVGLNEFIVETASQHNLKVNYDIRSFGKETRPIFKLLQYTNDPILPGITGDKANSMAFMVFCKEPLAEPLEEDAKAGGQMELDIDSAVAESERASQKNWKKWVDLSVESRSRFLSNLMKLLLANGTDYQAALRLLGESYVLNNEEYGTPLRDASEFATLLNACGRYGNAEIGYRVCSGDRGRFYEKALLLLQGHRKVLVENIKFVTDTGITERDYIQFFHGEDVIPENVVGIVAGMVLGSGEVNENLPMIGFTNSPEGIKVSGRTVQKVVRKGVNLAKAMNKASKGVGGGGGGHNIAAGAHIPKGKEEEFLEDLERIIEEQIEKGKES